MLLWLTLVVFLAGLVGGIAFAGLRGLALWRRVKRTSKAFGAEADRISRAAAEIEGQLSRGSAGAAKLKEATARLHLSRTQLDLQLAAVREARRSIARMFWFLPGA